MRLHIPLLPAHPIVRPCLAFVLLSLAVYSLLAHWQAHGGAKPSFFHHPSDEANRAQQKFEIELMDTANVQHVAGGGQHGTLGKPTGEQQSAESGNNVGKKERHVVAHFMLGNTYPFTERDWARTFDLAERTGLDGLALNLGPDPWQLEQAKTAFRFAERRKPVVGGRPVLLFFSLDMNVLAHSTWDEAVRLIDEISPLMGSVGAFRRWNQPLLSTFGGHDASWGGKGWKGFLAELNSKLKHPATFWPSFFMPPNDVLALDYVDGAMSWNNAWSLNNEATNLAEDMPFVLSQKPYMATVSPLFFTHYGSRGKWAFNKNWIYRSDELLYPTRWNLLMQLSAQRAPEIVQVISWNDYGESHYIGPVMGAQPGSNAWTSRMNHVAFRDLTRYFAARWRDGVAEVGRDIVVWMWYRPQPSHLNVPQDRIGRPKNADWAKDLINFYILCPATLESPVLEVRNGPAREGGVEVRPLTPGRASAITVPFRPGSVHFELRSKAGAHVRGTGIDIDNGSRAHAYNFNMWTGAWSAHAPRAGHVARAEDAVQILDDEFEEDQGSEPEA